MTNVSSKFREGWEPVKLEDHPELKVLPDVDSKFKGNVEVGGLLLCKNSKENMEARRDFQKQQADSQMSAVDNNFMKESDPRMPVLKPEKAHALRNVILILRRQLCQQQQLLLD